MTIKPAEEIVTLRIELCDSEPLIWRQLEVPTAITLKQLHDIVQIAMGWQNSHLWEFTIGKQRYGLPQAAGWADEPQQAAGKARLSECLKPGKTTLHYLYDFGDSWEHRLIFSKIRQAEPGVSYPCYIAGEWNAPPEDCGGLPGFYDMLDARVDASHPDHADIMEWLGDYRPETIDEVSIRAALARIAKRRVAARSRPGKKTASTDA